MSSHSLLTPAVAPLRHFGSLVAAVGARHAVYQAVPEELKGEVWQRERTGAKPLMLFLAASLLTTCACRAGIARAPRPTCAALTELPYATSNDGNSDRKITLPVLISLIGLLTAGKEMVD